MKSTLNFKELSRNDASIAGGKGASLGEMTQAGIPVPPGFIVTAEAFETFLKETDLLQEIDSILHKVNHNESQTIERASEEIRELILNAEMPKGIADEIHRSLKDLNTKYVAVRSSATAEDGMDHAWAGQLESYLNTTEDQVLTKVKLCWSSLFTPRAIFYRFEKGLHTTKISVAVVVQKMVESEVSGIAFSVHPVTEDYNQLIIEAGFGLGEAIVSGSVTPDSYVVEKEPRNIIDINISTQNRALHRSEKVSAEHGNNEWADISEPKASSQVLTKEQILELSEIILQIEKHYGFPCDIEWAYEAGKFYIVQCRPITTLNKNTIDTSKGQNSLNYEFINSLKNRKVIRIEGDFIPFLIFVDWLNFYKEDGQMSNIYPYVFYFSKEKKVGYVTDSYSDCARYTFAKLLEGKMVITEIEDKYNKSVDIIKDKYNKYFLNKTLDNQTENELFLIYKEIYIEFRELVARTLFTEQLDETIVQEVLTQYNIGNIDELWEIVKIPHFLSFESRNNQTLVDVIENKKQINYLSYVYLNYTFIPDVKYLNNAVKNLDLKVIIKSVKDADFNLNKTIKEYNSKLDKLPEFEKKIVNVLSWVMKTRDQRKDIINMAQMLLFVISEKLFEYWKLDINLLRYTGMSEIILGKEHILLIKEDIRKRQNGFGFTYKVDNSYELKYGSFISEIETLDKIILGQNKNDDGAIKGEIGNKGKVTGRVHIILKRNQFDEFIDGEVLVTGMTRPEFVPLMKKSIAIITDEGGITSHAAIVSRELKKPCIIGTKIATQVLKDGDIVEVDADNVVVRKLS